MSDYTLVTHDHVCPKCQQSWPHANAGACWWPQVCVCTPCALTIDAEAHEAARPRYVKQEARYGRL